VDGSVIEALDYTAFAIGGRMAIPLVLVPPRR
jgi:hypothetical protein